MNQKLFGIKKIIRILFFFFISLSASVYSQKQASIWYFGDRAGIDFNSGDPVDISPGLMYTEEGSASIADTNGNLLFYTDGDTVWDKGHVPMPNGKGLKGHSSSTQSAIITPHLANAGQYYIFTIRGHTSATVQQGSHRPELNYSIVDMNLPGNGIAKGDVVAGFKNIFLTDSTGEKITAVMHANSVSYWIVISKYYANQFYSYHVTCQGVDTVPVISSFNTYTVTEFSGIGCMKASADAKTIAVATEKQILMFDFDNNTGYLSQPKKISSSNTGGVYGVEFSPNDSLIYASRSLSNKGVISQYKRFDANVAATETTIHTATNQGFFHDEIYAIQLAPDDKIYFIEQDNSGSSFQNICRIDNPNQANNPVISKNVINPGGGAKVWLGLPTYFNIYVTKEARRYSNDWDVMCLGDSVTIGPVAFPGFQYSWSPVNFLNNPSIAQPIAKPDNTTTYQLSVINECNDTIKNSVTVYVVKNPVFSLGNDTSICSGKSITLGAPIPQLNYLWGPENSTGSSIIVSETEYYSLLITNDSASCSYSDTIHISFVPCLEFVPNVFTPNDDGINDQFVLNPLSFNEMECKIYNRWGIEVGEITKTAPEWNGISSSGELLPTGIYYYILKGENYKSEKVAENGFIHLLR